MKSLLLRPPWIEGESWPGFLLRIAQANQLTEGLSSLGEMMGITGMSLLMADPAGTLLQLGYNAPDIQPRRDLLERGPKAMPFRSGRSRYVAFCSKCLLEDYTPHMRAQWDRPFQFHCTVHQSGLHRTCPNCKQPVSALRKNLERCDCGHSLAASKTARTLAGADVLRSFLHVHTTIEPQTFEGASQQELSAVLLVQRILHIVSSSSPSHPGHRKPRLKDVWLTDRDLSDVTALFSQWPTSFEQGFLRLIDGSKPPSALLPARLGFTLAQFPHIEKAIRDVDMRKRCSPRPRGVAPVKRDHMGIKELMTKSGMHYTDICRWIEKGFLGPVTVLQTPQGKRYQIPIDHAVEAIGLIKRTSSMLAMQREVGLSRIALNALSRASVLQSTRIGPATYTARLNPSEVYTLVQSVLKLARTPDRPFARILTFSQAIERVYKKSPLGSVAMFWQAIISGHLPVYRIDDAPTSLESVYLCAGDLLSWRSALRA